MLNDQDIKNGCKNRKRKNSESSCISSSHSTVSGINAVSEESPNQAMQAFMLEEYTLDSEQKCTPCLVYLPIKKHLVDESPFTVKIKIRPLTNDEKEKIQSKSLSQISINELSSKTQTDQNQLKEVESSSLIEKNEIVEKAVENEKNAVDFNEDSNDEIKLEISSED